MGGSRIQFHLCKHHRLYARCPVGWRTNPPSLCPAPPPGSWREGAGLVTGEVSCVQGALAVRPRPHGMTSLSRTSPRILLGGGRLRFVCFFMSCISTFSPHPLLLQGGTRASGILFSACSHGRAVGEFCSFSQLERKEENLQTHKLPGISGNLKSKRLMKKFP